MTAISQLPPEKQWEIQQAQRNQSLRGDVLAALICFGSMAIVAVPRFNGWADAAVAWAWTSDYIAAQQHPSAKMQAVINEALSWVEPEGKVYMPGKTEQCAYFVRHVFQEAGIDLGVSQKPYDLEHTGTIGGDGIASSLAGIDIASKAKFITDPLDLRPGDIVFHEGTYGQWKGTRVITHVGIVVASNENGDGLMVDRPTASKPVQKRRIDVPGRIAVGVRIYP